MLITNDELKQYLKLGDVDDCDVSIFAKGASDYITNYIGRDLSKKTYTELYDGHHEMDIVLNNYPIISIASVSHNTGTYNNPIWDLIDEDKRQLNTKNGVLSFDFLVPRGTQNIKIVYTAGYDIIPNDLRIAALSIGSMLYNQRLGDGIKEETVGGDKIVYDRDITPLTMSILNKYI